VLQDIQDDTAFQEAEMRQLLQNEKWQLREEYLRPVEWDFPEEAPVAALELLSRRWERLKSEFTKRFGLSPLEYQTLLAVWHYSRANKPLSVGQMEKILTLGQPSLASALISRMKNKENPTIRLIDDKSHPRRRILQLTDYGESVLKEAFEYYKTKAGQLFSKPLSSGTSEQQMAHLLATFREIRHRVDDALEATRVEFAVGTEPDKCDEEALRTSKPAQAP